MNNPDVTEKQKTPAASTPASGSAHYLDAQCSICGWKDGIRADYWNPNREYWCDGCGGEQTFKLCAPNSVLTEPPLE